MALSKALSGGKLLSKVYSRSSCWTQPSLKLLSNGTSRGLGRTRGAAGLCRLFASSSASGVVRDPPGGADRYVDIASAIPTHAHSTLVSFTDHRVCDFKYIWLRDCCRCAHCVHPDTQQKLLDTPELDVNLVPQRLTIDDDGNLTILWPDNHESTFEPQWLHKHGRYFQKHSPPELPQKHSRPDVKLWDRVSIWKQLPEMPYSEVMQTEDGLFTWLDMIHKYGLAFLKDVPVEDERQVLKVVERLAYVKETNYGVTFDVISEPDPKAHLAYTGAALAHHTDMNYREKSPGIQMLHCLRANDVSDGSTGDALQGGKSFFVDGFHVAHWLQETHPSAFHILSSVEVKFSIISKDKRYSQYHPIINVSRHGDIEEVHINNRTMGPVHCAEEIVIPFYHAYKLLHEKIRDQSLEMRFNMVPGDLVLFNNRRILHGRTQFDPRHISRHLKGCYVDIDELYSKYDGFLLHATPVAEH